MRDDLRFSVITVNYQNAAGLAATERSVVAQDFDAFEWIVIDGGSTDASVEVASSSKIDRKIVISELDNGIFDAMQKGLCRAKAEYVIFMNSGDRFARSDVLRNVHDAIGENSPDLVFGDAYEEDGEGKYFKPARNPLFNKYAMFTHHQAQFYRRQAVRSLGGFDLTYSLSADWVLTSRVLASGSAIRADVTVCIFERGGISQRKDRRRILNYELFRIYREEQGHSLPATVCLWLLKVGVNKARQYVPALYDRLRYRARELA